jgi:septum formation protein
VLAADTTVCIGGEILGTPANAAEAADFLARLSGREHEVLTAIAFKLGERMEDELSVTAVRFRTLERAEIARYVASGEPMDKAGAYGIQGRAGAFVSEIRGSYSGVMGLPLHETALLLRRFGIGPA